MADSGFQSPLIDFFRRGEVARDIRLLAAQGAFAPRAQEQIALLVLLSDDPDPDIKRATAATLEALPIESLRGFLGRSDTPPETVKFFAALGVDVPAGTPPPRRLSSSTSRSSTLSRSFRPSPARPIPSTRRCRRCRCSIA